MSKNNFLHIFSLIANPEWHFPPFSYGRCHYRLSIIPTRARVDEIWHSATVSRRWLKLGQVWGMNWQTYWGNIIKIIDSLGKGKIEFLFFLCHVKQKLLKSSYFHHIFWQIRCLENEGRKVNLTNFEIWKVLDPGDIICGWSQYESKNICQVGNTKTTLFHSFLLEFHIKPN